MQDSCCLGISYPSGDALLSTLPLLLSRRGIADLGNVDVTTGSRSSVLPSGYQVPGEIPLDAGFGQENKHDHFFLHQNMHFAAIIGTAVSQFNPNTPRYDVAHPDFCGINGTHHISLEYLPPANIHWSISELVVIKHLKTWLRSSSWLDNR